MRSAVMALAIVFGASSILVGAADAHGLDNEFIQSEVVDGIIDNSTVVDYSPVLPYRKASHRVTPCLVSGDVVGRHSEDHESAISSHSFARFPRQKLNSLIGLTSEERNLLGHKHRFPDVIFAGESVKPTLHMFKEIRAQGYKSNIAVEVFRHHLAGIYKANRPVNRYNLVGLFEFDKSGFYINPRPLSVRSYFVSFDHRLRGFASVLYSLTRKLDLFIQEVRADRSYGGGEARDKQSPERPNSVRFLGSEIAFILLALPFGVWVVYEAFRYSRKPGSVSADLLRVAAIMLGGGISGYAMLLLMLALG